MKEKFGLTVPQVNLAADVLAVVFPDRLECHPEELHTAAGALRAAAMVCEIAAALHEKDGREVLLKTACQKLYLPPAKQDAVGAGGTQELIAKMFGPVNVGVVDPIANRRDPWEPKLVAAIFNEEEAGFLQDKELVRRLIEGETEVDNGEYTIVPKDLCVGRETEQEWRDVREDLTALGEEPKGDEQPEICSGCGRKYSTCGYQPGYQDCEGFER